MTDFPVIKTALPHRRYRVGDYAVSVLGDIDSGDGIDYRYILAFVADGQQRPSLYVCCERSSPQQRERGAFRIRIVNSAMSEILGEGDLWGDFDAFVTEALQIGKRILGIAAEQEYRLS